MTDQGYLTLPEAAEELGVHYMTVYRYVRTGQLPAERVGGSWRVERSELENLRRPPSVATSRRAKVRPSRDRLQSRLVAGDEVGAWRLIEAALTSDMTPESVLLDLIGPTLHSIGTEWERGQLSVADEHRASAVATRLIGRLGARFARRGVRRGTVILAAGPGERHGLPVAIAANLLRWRGFTVVELGADTPGDALVDAVGREQSLVAVGLACTSSAASTSARRAIAQVHRAAPRVPVLVGGAAVTDGDHARRLGADRYTGKRADELVSAIEDIVAGG
jgi:MerR family transcriptional regulator, light-induced transcriptional regulator